MGGATFDRTGRASWVSQPVEPTEPTEPAVPAQVTDPQPKAAKLTTPVASVKLIELTQCGC